MNVSSEASFLKTRYDAAVIGAGILGLAHAHALARRGLKVAVVERDPEARGASVRNFGLIWPIGQPAGPMFDLALRSREIWLEVLRSSGVRHCESGALLLAEREDEAAVSEEFLAAAAYPGARILAPGEAANDCPLIRSERIVAALWTPLEVTVDPREALSRLPEWLTERWGVDFYWSSAAIGYQAPILTTQSGRLRADRLAICAGADFQTLYPTAFAAQPLRRCKLQMMRTRPLSKSARLGPAIATGLSLRHYPSFAGCPSLAGVCQRMESEMPDYVRYGIHVMATQNAKGEMVIGDSHEYEPFPGEDNPEIDRLILDYLSRVLDLSETSISARWSGTYLKHPSEPYVVAYPTDEVMAVTGVGGAGMTLGFALAEKLVGDWLS